MTKSNRVIVDNLLNKASEAYRKLNSVRDYLIRREELFNKHIPEGSSSDKNTLSLYKREWWTENEGKEEYVRDYNKRMRTFENELRRYNNTKKTIARKEAAKLLTDSPFSIRLKYKNGFVSLENLFINSNYEYRIDNASLSFFNIVEIK